MIMFLSKNWNFNKMSPKYPLESLENRARRGKIYMYLLKKCETKAEDQWRRANTGIVCVFQCIPHQCQASKSGFLAEFLTVPSCSNKNSKLFPSPTCMPDLEMKNAKLRARPCMYASATAEMPGCSKPGKQYGSNIPQDHWKTKPSTSAERERSIEKYREVLWLLCHYYAITMRYCGYLMLRLGMTWNDYVATAAHSSTMARASLVWWSSIGILEQCWKRQVTQFADILYHAKISVTALWILKVHKCLAHGWKWRKDFWPVTKKMAPSNGCICCHSFVTGRTGQFCPRHVYLSSTSRRQGGNNKKHVLKIEKSLCSKSVPSLFQVQPRFQPPYPSHEVVSWPLVTCARDRRGDSRSNCHRSPSSPTSPGSPGSPDQGPQ